MADTSDTSPLLRLLGQAAYGFSLVQPYLPTYFHLILSAVFPIFIGAHASLSRPSSASKRAKHPKKEDQDPGSDVEDSSDDEVESGSQMEGLQPSDALLFPLMAGSTLVGLYLLIKWLEDPSILNTLLNAYFSLMAIWSVGCLFSDAMNVAISFLFPGVWTQRKRIVVIDRHHETVRDLVTKDVLPDLSPLRLLGSLKRRSKAESLVWALRALLTEHWVIVAKSRGKLLLRGKVSTTDALGLLGGLLVVIIYNFISKWWALTNIMGFGFAYGAFQLLSPTTFGTGSLVLAALFFYDIYFVFYTPMMVSVATSLDVPIKLLFPRPPQAGADQSKASLAMLGLGDVVIPGIMIGLALRFDLYLFYLRKQIKPTASQSTASSIQTEGQSPQGQVHKAEYRKATGAWGERYWLSSSTLSYLSPFSTSAHLPVSATPLVHQPKPMPQSFPKPYFLVSLTGYIIGLIVTLAVMHIYGHAQPALLYLVPGVILSLWGTALVRGELKLMMAFSDSEEEEQKDPKDKEKRKSDEKAESAVEATSNGDGGSSPPDVKHHANSTTSSAKSVANGPPLSLEEKEDDEAHIHEEGVKSGHSENRITLFDLRILAPARKRKPPTATSVAPPSSLASRNHDAQVVKGSSLDVKGAPVRKRPRLKDRGATASSEVLGLD